MGRGEEGGEERERSEREREREREREKGWGSDIERSRILTFYNDIVR